MIRSTSSRLRAALVALTMTAAATGTVIAGAQPAHAATTCSTTTVVDEGNHANNHVKTWGDFEAVHVNVTASCSDATTTYVSIGTTTLYASTDGGSSWTPVSSASNYDAAYLSVYGTNVIKRTTIYRAVYTGGNDTSNARTYSGSTDDLTIGMIRHVAPTSRCTSRGCKVTFHVGPAASIRGGYATIQRRRSGSWRTYHRSKVGYSGTFAYFLPTGYYRVLLPAGRGFLASRHGTYHVYR